MQQALLTSALCYDNKHMDEYLTFAKNLAHDAGTIMLEHFQIGVSKKIKAYEGNSPVTVADTTINERVIEAVQAAYPTHAVIGEEQSLKVAHAPYAWVCDPIDGTIPYAAGVPTNVFSLALVDTVDGQPKLAVVYDPYLDRLYHAVAGGGAFVNDTQVHVNHVSDLRDAMVGTSSKRSLHVDSGAIKAELNKIAYGTFMLHSTIYESMLVATGQIVAQIFVGKNAHDTAAAKLIIEEAGGKVTDLFGENQRYDQEVRGALFSNGMTHDELLAIIDAHKLTAGVLHA